MSYVRQSLYSKSCNMAGITVLEVQDNVTMQLYGKSTSSGTTICTTSMKFSIEQIGAHCRARFSDHVIEGFTRVFWLISKKYVSCNSGFIHGFNDVCQRCIATVSVSALFLVRFHNDSTRDIDVVTALDPIEVERTLCHQR